MEETEKFTYPDFLPEEDAILSSKEIEQINVTKLTYAEKVLTKIDNSFREVHSLHLGKKTRIKQSLAEVFRNKVVGVVHDFVFFNQG